MDGRQEDMRAVFVISTGAMDVANTVIGWLRS
jgi:hypothetical protein